ncbi:hypothetical protein F4808DRAFT_409748 [Astrocystis sublimbata]|nr:hypothetical protein F4808DRAFT_409748 [Astrocystis sublimbata]
MAVKPVALILGYGPRIGVATARNFANNGYDVVVTSRKGTGTRTAEGYLSLKVDLTHPDSIPALYDAIKAEFNTSPSAVIYNAAALTNPPSQDSMFSIRVEDVTSDLNVNTVSPYVAAQQAVAGWETLPAGIKKTFIYTGNVLNITVIPMALFTNLGMGKAASAYWLGVADGTYSTQGYRFFYADERTETGKNVGNDIDGSAHASFFEQLANHEGNVPWHATFVKGKGYVKF